MQIKKLANMQIVNAQASHSSDDFCRILVSPTINTPEPFRGFGGFCGWPVICRLQNGDLYVTFTAGYWHASWVTPWIESQGREYAEKLYRRFPWARDWDAPEGGRMMWIRSKDNGQTWTRPMAFPSVPGAYGVGDIIQLGDGTLLAGANIQIHMGYRTHMPTTPKGCAEIYADLRMKGKMVFFHSYDNGETWQEIGRDVSPFLFTQRPQTFLEMPDGSVLMLTDGVLWPAGKEWPTDEPRFLSAFLKSFDKGKTWQPWSIIGDNDYDTEEASATILPDGSIGFASRPTSAWFQSYDGGKSWTDPVQLRPGENAANKALYKKGDLVVTPDGVTVLVYCVSEKGGHGRVIYSRDSGKSWIRPEGDERGFHYDYLSYYPHACVLEDGSVFVVGDHQKLPNEYGPYGGEVRAVRFRIKSPEEGEGIELLPIGKRKQERTISRADVAFDSAGEVDDILQDD